MPLPTKASVPTLHLTHSLPFEQLLELLETRVTEVKGVHYSHDQVLRIAVVKYSKMGIDLLHARITFTPEQRQAKVEILGNKSPFPNELIFEELPVMLGKLERGEL